MTNSPNAATGTLGAHTVRRIGYGAMQLAGPGVFGPPADRAGAVAVLRRAVELGVDHIDTSDFYGPHVTNEIIREALHPYPENLVLVTKVGARRDDKGQWPTAISADELRSAVHDNLKRLGVDRLDVVNLRMPDENPPDITEPFAVLAELREQGLIAELGVSNVSADQLTAARTVAPVVCVQNAYNVALRGDDALLEQCAEAGIAFVPFFPLGGFSPLRHQQLDALAQRLSATPMQVALAWLLQRSPAILLIPGTSSVAHLEQNLAAGELTLDAAALSELDGLAG